MSPFTQSLPSADGDGDDEEGAELVGFADVGLAVLDPPHAATDSAVSRKVPTHLLSDPRACRYA